MIVTVIVEKDVYQLLKDNRWETISRVRTQISSISLVTKRRRRRRIALYNGPWFCHFHLFCTCDPSHNFLIFIILPDGFYYTRKIIIATYQTKKFQNNFTMSIYLTNLMKNIFKLLAAFLILAFILSSCSSSKYSSGSMHNHGVNNRSYRGY